MATGGYGVGGSSTAGPSPMFAWLPWKGYRETGTWLEEFVDAIGSQFAILESRFISSTARSRLLDPTYTPAEVASANLATATAPPSSSVVTDTMLDVLLYIACGQYPVNPKLSTAQKQALVSIGWDALRRKGTRQRLLNLVAQVTGGPIGGWTTPPYLFGVIMPDGAPSPGYGDWTPVPVLQVGTVTATSGSAALPGAGTSFLAGWAGYKIIIGSTASAQIYTIASVTNGTNLVLSTTATANAVTQPYYIVPGATVRPWAFDAARSLLSNVTPAWSNVGVGFSQFRAGYSAAGEIVMPSGSRLAINANESFSSWSAGTPDLWSLSGAATLTQAVRVTGTSYEFSNYACRIDLTGAAAGVAKGIAILPSAVNNQRQHRVELDYAYTNPQSASTLVLSIQEGSTGYFYNIASGAWQATNPGNVVPASASRGTYAFNFAPITSTITASVFGPGCSVQPYLSVTSDGTSTTQTTYDLFRFGMYETYNQAIEATFEGEPIGWWPLVDSYAWETPSRAGTQSLVEPQNYDRSKVRLVAGNGLEFAYHPALSGKGARITSNWTNLCKGSNVFTAPDWTAAASAYSASQTASPVIGDTSSAPRLTANSAGNYGSVDTDTGVNPASKSYIAGVWAKNLNAYTGDVRLSLISGGTTKIVSYSLTGTGWKFLAMPAQTFGAGDTSNLHFKAQWDTTGAGGQLSLFAAYVYDVTGKTDVLYPPVSISASTLTSTVTPPTIKATTATTDTNVLHPLTQRTMASTSSGSVSFTIVPTFGAASQPDCSLFEVCQSGVLSGVYIYVSSSGLRMRRRDSTGALTSMILSMTTSATPSSSQVTWQRDTAIVIRARWAADGSMSLGAGASSVSAAAVGGWLPSDASVAKIRIGCDSTGVSQFDGIIRDVRSVQFGNPAT